MHTQLCSARARGDNRPESDIDILVEIAPDICMDVFSVDRHRHSIEDLFPMRVEVSNRIALKSHVRPSAERDAIYAFLISQIYSLRHPGNILLAQQFIEGLTYDGFRNSRLHFYAVTRALEIVSEASRHLPEDLRAQHPHLSRRAIRDVGNFYRHQYDDVVESYVWETVRVHLAPLQAAILAEIVALGTKREQ